jgi:large conductance mechanosensitive channel
VGAAFYTPRIAHPFCCFREGVFINTIITFLVMALAMFFLVKSVNAMRRRQAEAPAAPLAATKEEQLLTKIHDLLKGRA